MIQHQQRGRRMATGNEFVTNIVLDAAMMPELQPREKALRDTFVVEYLKDYNAFAACLRCGFMRSFAEEYAVKFMEEPYVRQQLDIVSNLSGGDSEESVAYTKQRIINGLMREAHYHGEGSSAGARVAALGKLAQIHGMVEKVGKKETGQKTLGGVMRVPEISDVTQWEEVATGSQERLVTDVRN
jgi:hypothetical protein